jgi:3-hydroxyisobutyrate dehydrogenase-like beta-hydroxyacid dehydrogenase
LTKKYTLGVLGFGEASQTISEGLHSKGLEGIHIWKRKPWSPEVVETGQRVGAILCESPSKVLAVSDIIFSLVTPSAAQRVAQQAAEGIAGKFYLDLNAASLHIKEKAADTIRASGGWFIDGAIMGPLKKQRHRVSTLISGDRSEKLAVILKEWGMDVRSIGVKAGLASTVKMIRSVYTKGLEATVLEFMVAANRYDAIDAVFASLEELLAMEPFRLPFREMAAALVLEQVEHAARRSTEMEQVVATMEDLKVEPFMARGALKRLHWAAEEINLRQHFGARPPENYKEVLEAIEAKDNP